MAEFLNPDLATVDHSELAQQLGDRLLRVSAPLPAHFPGCDPAEYGDALDSLRNPYAVGENPGAFHTTGWLGAYETRHSPVAVAAESVADILAAVNFARARGLGLVVKGTGHDYLGRSSAPYSLLVWTHRMRDITVHEDFRPTGPDAGFGHLSRRYGTAAGNVLQVEVVTASGEIMVANASQHQDLFWALRGGGGGTFGVVSRLAAQFLGRQLSSAARDQAHS